MCDVLFQLATLYMPHIFQNQMLPQSNMALPQYPVSCVQFVWDWLFQLTHSPFCSFMYTNTGVHKS
jgi:hypothetical protein